MTQVIHPTNKPNFCTVDSGGLKLWYSYETCIAFDEGGGPVVCQNVWGNTTGRHLNLIDGGDQGQRLTPDLFKARLAEVTNP